MTHTTHSGWARALASPTTAALSAWRALPARPSSRRRRRSAYRRIRPTAGNANDWLVVATARTPTNGWICGMGAAPLAMLGVALVIIVLAGVSLRAARRELEIQATTDALTGLGNRRKLHADLDRRVKSARADEPAVLTLFDLNGFKNYNDAFGHPAGDALLRSGSPCPKRSLHSTAPPTAPAATSSASSPTRRDSTRWSRQRAPHCRRPERASPSRPHSARSSPSTPATPPRQCARPTRPCTHRSTLSAPTPAARATTSSSALAERHPDLSDHLDGVTELATDVARRVGIDGEALTQLRHAASLHDIGKVAIPDAIITKATALDDDEWAFMRRHTLIGERIIAAAPALGRAAKLVRSSHEAFDGSGYPDALAGVEIPLGARIIAVCDAFDAMISNRPYSPAKTTGQALAELRRCAGTQFDPTIVAVFEQVIANRSQAPTADASA